MSVFNNEFSQYVVESDQLIFIIRLFRVTEKVEHIWVHTGLICVFLFNHDSNSHYRTKIIGHHYLFIITIIMASMSLPWLSLKCVKIFTWIGSTQRFILGWLKEGRFRIIQLWATWFSKCNCLLGTDSAWFGWGLMEKDGLIGVESVNLLFIWKRKFVFGYLTKLLHGIWIICNESLFYYRPTWWDIRNKWVVWTREMVT